MKKKSKIKYFYNFSPFLGINVSTNRMQIQGYYIYILALENFRSIVYSVFNMVYKWAKYILDFSSEYQNGNYILHTIYGVDIIKHFKMEIS